MYPSRESRFPSLPAISGFTAPTIQSKAGVGARLSPFTRLADLYIIYHVHKFRDLASTHPRTEAQTSKGLRHGPFTHAFD